MVQGSFAMLDNRNPQADIDFDFQSRQTSVSFYWTPSGGRRFTLLADYARASPDLAIRRPPCGFGAVCEATFAEGPAEPACGYT